MGLQRADTPQGIATVPETPSHTDWAHVRRKLTCRVQTGQTCLAKNKKTMCCHTHTHTAHDTDLHASGSTRRSRTHAARCHLICI